MLETPPWCPIVVQYDLFHFMERDQALPPTAWLSRRWGWTYGRSARAIARFYRQRDAEFVHMCGRYCSEVL